MSIFQLGKLEFSEGIQFVHCPSIMTVKERTEMQSHLTLNLYWKVLSHKAEYKYYIWYVGWWTFISSKTKSSFSVCEFMSWYLGLSSYESLCWVVQWSQSAVPGVRITSVICELVGNTHFWVPSWISEFLSMGLRKPCSMF